MDNENIQDLNGIKPKKCKAKVELLGSYDPSGEFIIRDPYYVCYFLILYIKFKDTIKLKLLL